MVTVGVQGGWVAGESTDCCGQDRVGVQVDDDIPRAGVGGDQDTGGAQVEPVPVAWAAVRR